MTMTWEDLIAWAKAKGKDESDVLDWYALSEVQSIRELDDQEMVDVLRAGIKYDRAYVEDHWTTLDDETQQLYLTYMTDAWKEQT